MPSLVVAVVDLPAWAHTIRPAQQEAVDAIIRRFESGAQVVVLDAPTGSGKTLVAELVRRALTARALYLCVDRGLQDQVLRDFDYAKVIKGRRNYPTLLRPQAFPEITTEDCKAGRKRCEWCDRHGPCEECRMYGRTRCEHCDEREACPYTVAKTEALRAELACGNVSYFLAEANGPGTFSDWPLIIADEADRLESVLMGAVTAQVSHRRLETLNVRPITGEEKPTEAAAWITRDVLPAITEEVERITRRDPNYDDLRLTRQRKAWLRLFTKLEVAAEHLAEGTWVTTTERSGRGEDNDGSQNIVFKPVRVNEFGQDLLWRHADRWLLMSATVLNPAGLVRDLGIDPERWAVVRMGSTFPAARRPIHSLAVAPVTAKHMEAALPKVAGALLKILAEHPHDRILVHTVSFKLMDALRRSRLGLDPRCLWYTGADSRAEILRQYLDTKGAVLLAPALERGLDLPDDACRVVVVAKVPYPDLGDKVVAARLHNTPDGQGWYRDQTLRSLVQMTGRGMRHAEDHCVTYLLDAQFDVVLARHRAQLPAWWVEAVQP